MKRKLTRLLLVLGMIASFLVILWQGYELLCQWELKIHREIMSSFSEYYEFSPNDSFAKEAAKRMEAYTAEKIYERNALVYTEYLKKWDNDAHMDILRLEKYTLCQKDDLEVISYINPLSYEVRWEDFSLPIKEGRWFDGDKDEVICVAGWSYKIGDTILLEDTSGQAFEAVVVGETKYPLLPDNYQYIKGEAGTEIENHFGLKNLLLLNPQSSHNIKSDLINDGATLLKIDNDIVSLEISQHGECVSLKEEMIRNEPDFKKPLITMGLALVLFVIFWVSGVILQKQEKKNSYNVIVLRKQRMDDI